MATVTGIKPAGRADAADWVRRRIRDAMVEAGIAGEYNDRSGTLTDNARVVLQRRYLSKDREGNVLEDPEGMFRRVAHNLSQSELEYGATEEERARGGGSVLPGDAAAGIPAQLANFDERRARIAAGCRRASCCRWRIRWIPFSPR